MPKLILECGHTLANPTVNTGIQRVIRRLGKELPGCLPEALEGFELCFGQISHGALCKAEYPAFDDRPPAPKETSKSRAIVSTAPLGRPKWVSFVPKPLRPKKYRKKRAQLAAEMALLADRTPPPEPDRLAIGEGDILVLADLNWLLDQTTVQMIANEVRAKGGRVVTVVYDIIPITHPWGSHPEHLNVFTRWLSLSLRYTDQYVAISRSVVDRFSHWRSLVAPRSIAPVSWFHLGCDIADRPDIAQAQAHAHPDHFLMVSSLSHHKQQLAVLERFERLWADGLDLTLTLVGRDNSPNDHISAQLLAHPAFGKHLFWIDRATEAQLRDAYGKANCLIIASDEEGLRFADCRGLAIRAAGFGPWHSRLPRTC